MRKIVNYRPILFFAIALILGGYSFVWLFKFNWVIFIISGGILGVVGFSIFVAIKRKNLKLLLRVFCLAIIPFVVGGMVISYFVNKKLSVKPASGTYYFECTVVSGGVDSEGKITAIIDDISISSPKKDQSTTYYIQDEVYLSGYLKSEQDINIGDKISFVGSYSNEFRENIEENVLLVSSYVGYAYNYSDITILENGSGIKYNILKWSKDTLYKHMDKENADVSFAMIFGEKLNMDKDLKQTYNLTGLSHILAVSGLHVGFVILLVGWILKKLINNKCIYSVLLLSFLLFYAYLCGWASSVIRAVVMCGVLLLSDSLNVQYDGLNALSIAGIVNFIVAPLNIFDVGFLLSFTVVFSIFSIAPQIKFLLKKKMPRKLASTISLSVSAWLGSTAILVYYFKSLTPYSVIINIIVVPFVGIIFLTTAICLLLTLLPVAGGFFLAVPNFMIGCLNFVVEGFSALKGAGLNFSCSYPIMLLGVCAIIVASDYNFIKRKWLYAGTLAFGFLCCAVIYSL